MLTVVAEIFSDSTCGIRCDVLHRRRLRCRSRYHDGVIHRAEVGERLHHLGNGRTLLPDGAVNTYKVVALAVDDGVERDCGFARLPVADDQLALSAANRDHAVNGLESGGHGLAYRLAVDYARSDALDGDELLGIDGPLVVNRLAERGEHAPHHGIAHRDAHDALRALHLVAFFDLGVIAQQHRAHLVFFQVHGDSRHAVPEANQLAGHHLIQLLTTRHSASQCNHPSLTP